MSFHIAHVRIISSMECGKTRDYYFHENQLKKMKSKKYYAQKYSKKTGIEIQSQHWGGNRQLSMEVIAVEYFKNYVHTGSNEKNQDFFHI